MVKPSRDEGLTIAANAPREGLALLCRPADKCDDAFTFIVRAARHRARHARASRRSPQARINKIPVPTPAA